MMLVIGICAAVFVAAALAIVLRRRCRTIVENPPLDARRHRAVLDDCGDDTVWEAGKRRSVAESGTLTVKVSKRVFLKRAALTVSAFSLTWLMTRGRSKAAGLGLPPEQGDGSLDKRLPTQEFDFNGIGTHSDEPHDDQPHDDSYNDNNHSDADDLVPHMDIVGHTDSPPGGHGDNGHLDA